MREAVIIQWLGHACFKVTGGAYSIVLDPYEDGYVPGFGFIRTMANQVLCSHGHKDHGFEEAVTIRDFEGASPWKISVVDSWHDDQEGTLRGENRIHVLDLNGFRVVHMGDLGCMLTKEQMEQIGTPDVLLMPVGGFYTIDAATAKKIADQLNAKVIIPMHYRSDDFGFDVLGTLDLFTDLCDLVAFYDSDSIEIDSGTEEQIVILQNWNEKE